MDIRVFVPVFCEPIKLVSSNYPKLLPLGRLQFQPQLHKATYQLNLVSILFDHFLSFNLEVLIQVKPRDLKCASYPEASARVSILVNY